MDINEEEEEETLLGSSNSELASELFPPDDNSDPEEEDKYLDDQVEDSDEEAEEEHEGDEQEMKEDRDFVDDTAVHDDFVHRLPSNKDDAGEVQKWVAHFQNGDRIALYERDVAREAVGGGGICHLRTGLQISKFERQRHLEMLEDVGVKVHTWFRAPKAFDCRIANERVSMARVITPDNESIDVGLVQLKRHSLDLYYDFRIYDRVCVVSGGLYVGDTGRVEQINGRFLIVAIPNNSEVIGETLPSTMSNGTKIFIVSIVHVTRQWAIGDSVCVTRGENENRRGVIFHLHQDGFLQLYDTNTTFSDEQLHSFKVRCSDVDFEDHWTDMATKLPFAGWSQSYAMADQPVSSALPFSLPDKSQCGFQGIKIMVAKPADFIVPSRETRGFSKAGTQGFIIIPHKGFIGIIIGDFNSQECSDRLKKAALDSLVCQAEEVNHSKQPHHKSQSRTGKLLKPEEPTYTCLWDPDVTGIMVTIRGDHSLETIHVPIEHHCL
ncbi:hypothetical protein B0H14DRAFT_3534787 [Mycena olivaceomarginata]|nr:hypothetical protein B0H14DRAFT_3534787 [Mycena olivaceomarginata]